MITKQKKVYYCQYCKKHGLSKSMMEYHEQICFNNPLNKRACLNCRHLITKKVDVYKNEASDNEYKYFVHVFYCDKKNIYLYPPQVEIKKNMINIGYDNNPMPMTCESQQEQGDNYEW